MPDRERILAALQSYADAWRAGDLPTLLATYRDDVVFHYFGRSAIGGAHEGKDAAVAAMQRTATLARRSLVRIVDVLAGEQLGSIVAIERFEREGLEPLEAQRVALYRVDDDGLITECWILDEDQRRMDDFWADAAT